jgi:glycosyltransferase involved in cell wall biosynthesis
MKKILIVTHHYPPHITGVGFVAQNHAKRLAALGNEVTVVTSDTGPLEKSYSTDGVNVVCVKAWNISESWDAPFPIFSPALLPALFKAVKQADIVHIHDAFYISSFWAAVIAKMYRKPIVLTQHVAMIAHPSRFVVMVEKVVYATSGALIFRLSNVIIAFNDRIERFLTERGVPKKKMVALFNGVDTNIFHPVALEEKQNLKKQLGFALNKKILLFVGRFIPKKGFDKILAAKSADYQIVCAGGAAPSGEFNEDVIFLGKLDQKDLARVYQAADVFMLPSKSEGFPLSIQEAMASGLPIITTDDSGYMRYGFDKKYISLIDDTNKESLRDAIYEIYHDDELLKEMGRYSAEYATQHFDWSMAISELDKLYEKCLRRKKVKKVAIVSDAVYPFNKGGKEKRIHDIVARLALKGSDVTIYCMKWWAGENTFIKDGVKFHAISPYYPLYAGSRRSIKEATFFALHCFKLLREDFDIIEVDHMPHLVLFTMKLVCLVKRKRMVVVWHEVVGLDYWKQYMGIAGNVAFMIEKISVTLPDVIISVSHHTTKALKSTLKAKKRIITIPNGLDFESILKIPPARSGADIIFAGRLLAHKNVDVLLDAINILKQRAPRVSALIIGNGSERDKLEGLAVKLGIQSNVSFRDFFEDHDDLYRVMKASKVFVLPSTREGFGIVVPEANACGLPVVTVNCDLNGAKELIINDENGIITALDPLQIAAAIEDLLTTKKDPAIYRKYAKEYDWKNIVARVEQVYAL